MVVYRNRADGAVVTRDH